MPELPEVETVRKLLQKLLIKKDHKALEIKDVIVTWPKMIKTHCINDFKNLLVGQKINKIDRYAKHLLFILDDYILISHLRMEGKYFYEKPEQEYAQRHVLARIVLSNGMELRYHDTRKFGTYHLYNKDEYKKTGPLTNVGPEPFEPEVTVKYLRNIFKGKTQAIKTKLLDQKVISGIGNIYVDEILFGAKIHPLSKPDKLSEKQIQLIIDESIRVLNLAIKCGGTTINTFEVSHGVTGMFQQKLQVQTRKGELCKNCGTIIEKIKVNGRGTYFCKKCQKKVE